MKTKTLVISYLPAADRSNTKQVLDAFLANLENTDTEHIDLLNNPPPFFTPASLAAYGIRNYGGAQLSEDLQEAIAPMDKLVKQFKSADVVVMAYPMHNFGMPGIIKTYFDAVMQHGELFQYGPNGPEGLMKGKKALTIFASGGVYTQGQATIEYPSWDTLTVLARIEFTFMGFSEIEIVGAQGVLNPAPGAKEAAIEEAKAKVKTLAEKWYAEQPVTV
jgi:FMN-dependent NADH-azoreductase